MRESLFSSQLSVLAALVLCLPAAAFALGSSADSPAKAVKASAERILTENFPSALNAAEAIGTASVPTATAKAVAAVSDPNAKDDDGTTALMRAAKDGHTEIVRSILAQPGVRVDEKDPLGHTALIIAAVNGRSEVTRLLLEAKADPNLADPEGETALMLAAVFGRTKTAQALLEGGADVNLKDKEGNTALIRSIAGGRRGTVSAIASARRVDLNAKNAAGTTALIEAARHDRDSELLSELLERGADKNLAGGYKDYDDRVVKDHTPLMVTVISGNVKGAKALLDKGADANRRDPEGNTALIMAVSGRGLDLVTLIASARGTDLNARNAAGTTPLIEAARRGDSAALAALLDSGADKDLIGGYKESADRLVKDHSPLMVAVLSRSAGCVKALIERKANLNYREPGGKTALGLAKTGWASKEIVDLLVAAGARE